MAPDQPPRPLGSGMLAIVLLVVVAVFVMTFDRLLACAGFGS